MSILDLRKREDRSPVLADVCLVGSGPAAWAIASRLRDSRIRVLIVESGGTVSTPQAQGLCQTEDVGAPLWNGRVRGLGGTTQAEGWGCRCTALDTVDYAARPWVPFSGWPFEAHELEPNLDAASELLGAGPFRLRPADMHHMPRAPGLSQICGEGLAPVYWNFGEAPDGGKTRIADLIRRGKPENLDIVVNATTTQVNVDPTGRSFASLTISDPEGRSTTVISRAAVLCAGGIENARILLNSDHQAPAGLGNQHDVVGRYLIDHPRDLGMALTFSPHQASQVRALFGPIRTDTGSGSKTFVGGLRLDPAYQERHELLNAAAWPIEELDESDPYTAFLRVIRSRKRASSADVKTALSHPLAVLRGLRARQLDQPTHRRPIKMGLVITSEQIPDPLSRVSLSSRRDRLGLRLARTDWRLHPEERRSQARLAQLINDACATPKLLQTRVAPWVWSEAEPVNLVDGCHPSGTTRMSADPRHGVVGPDCEVHGVSGLYIAGSSIFPTNGHANPTLTLVALACRLGDRLRAVLEATSAKASLEALPASQSAVGERGDNPVAVEGLRAAVTGGTGFLGARLIEELVSQRAGVRSLVRRPVAAAEPSAGLSERQVDLTDRGAVLNALTGVQVLFHCAYDWKDEGANITATANLVEACVLNHVRMVHVSTFALYELPASGALVEESVEHTATCGYAATKVKLEQIIREAVRDRQLQAVIIQPANIYGPGSGPWIDDPADMLAYGTVVLPDGGLGSANLVFVDDVVHAMLLAATTQAGLGETFLISNPEVVTWNRFYTGLAEVIGSQGPQSMSMAEIAERNRGVRKLARWATSPSALVRKLAGRKSVKARVQSLARLAPKPVRAGLLEWLYGPWQRRRGHLHVPDVGRATWMTSQATVSSRKAARLLGYEARVDLTSGLSLTTDYLTCRIRNTRSDHARLVRE